MERPGEWVSLDEARRRLLAICRRTPVVEVPVSAACGRVLAEAVVAPGDVPPFAASAMDGFAVRASDTSAVPVTLAIVGGVGAGRPSSSTVEAGSAVAIATGGAVPDGADAVCPIEFAEVHGSEVTILSRVDRGSHVRGAGSDTVAGSVVFAAGRRLGPAHVGVIAALGIARVAVHRAVRVGVLATGDELVDPPGVLGPGQIFDANRTALLAAVAEAGCVGVDLGIVGDDPSVLRDALTAASAGVDVIVTSGGVSVGEADHAKAVLRSLAPGSVEWLEVRIKPGKPVGFASLADSGTLVLCLPGNPVSALVVFEVLARPALSWMSGGPARLRRVERGRAVERFSHEPDGKLHLVRAVAETGDDGVVVVRSAGGQGSHQLRTLAEANALALVPEGVTIESGEPVEFVVLDPDRLAGDGVVR